MSDIPHEQIPWRIINIMKRNSQFHGAEIGRQMSADPADGFEDKRAEFIGDLRELSWLKRAQIGGRVDGFQQLFIVHCFAEP